MNKQLSSAITHQGQISWPRFNLTVALILAGTVVFVAALATFSRRDVSGQENVVTRCDRLAQIASNRRESGTLDPTSAAWRRARNKALETCLENPPAFERMVTAVAL
jgi:hypothetical protein